MNCCWAIKCTGRFFPGYNLIALPIDSLIDSTRDIAFLKTNGTIYQTKPSPAREQK